MESNKKYIPYNFVWDDVPLDLSFIYMDEKPAGKHGFIQVHKNRFIFEDGTEARFWGTNFNSGANFPAHSHSEKLAARLEKVGINLVRFHQMDAEWSTPNIFQFTKGRHQESTGEFDQDSMDHLDYLIHCLKQHGVYIYMDLLTYRKFKKGDGLENTSLLKDGAKPYTNYYKRLIELQKAFNYKLWNHVNPYTGLAYKDEPAIVLTEIANENELFNQASNPIIVEPYRSDLMSKYRVWAQGKRLPDISGEMDFSTKDENMLDFLCEVQKQYYKEMISHLRSIGVKIPLAGTNWAVNAALLSCQLATDFTDSHTYWCDWSWSDDNRLFSNRCMLDGPWNITTPLPFMRVLNKPFFISEWDDPWPNEWRSESTLLLAAVGALQGWTGFAVHTYRYDTDESTDMIGKEITSGAIGGVYYRGGLFDTFNDPAKFGLFYQAALLFRRGDLREAKESINIRIEKLKTDLTDTSCLSGASELHKIGMLLPEESDTADRIVLPDEALVETFTSEVISDTGEMYRNWEKRFGWIDTPRTKAVYGFLGSQGEIKLTGMIINSKTDFATIAISSLSNDELTDSPNLLLTAIGRADNSGSRYDDSHTIQLERGHGPVMIEVIEAQIELATLRKDLKVWAISDKGFLIGALPAEYEEGVFKFEIGKVYPSMYYLIQDQ